jgi:hypothetical protein
MICGRRRSDMASIEVDWPPILHVLPEAVQSSVRPLSQIEDAQLYPTRQVQISEIDPPMPMERLILR